MTFPLSDQWRVLLIDPNSLKRQIRAAVFRNCEVEVHTAENLSDAGLLWNRCSYDLVLFAADEHSEEAITFCGELKKSRPRQRIALLVGAPQYVREIGRKRKEAQSGNAAPQLQVVTTQPTQWQGTVDRLLGAG